MPGENEEAMRVLLMLGQAVLPPAREVLIITMRALARGTGKVAGGAGRVAGRGANHAISHVNGLGRYGLVTEHTLRRDRNDVIKLVNLGKEGALDRSDLSLLSDICRKHRIGFAVRSRAASRCPPIQTISSRLPSQKSTPPFRQSGYPL